MFRFDETKVTPNPDGGLALTKHPFRFDETSKTTRSYPLQTTQKLPVTQQNVKTINQNRPQFAGVQKEIFTRQRTKYTATLLYICYWNVRYFVIQYTLIIKYIEKINKNIT